MFRCHGTAVLWLVWSEAQQNLNEADGGNGWRQEEWVVTALTASSS